MSEKLINRNRDYWTNRAPGYTLVNLDELNGVQKNNWKKHLESEINTAFPNRDRSEISILDIGCGPGFFSIILTEMGYKVTAIDLTEAMLLEAKQNAKDLSEKIVYKQMNAQKLEFEDCRFDVIISRNLTWNLPEPQKAYSEWCRVLKKDGLFLNFDANWYHYLFDEEQHTAFLDNRQELVSDGYEDYCAGTDEDEMESIARQMPLSRLDRPKWDEACLNSLGMRDFHSIWDIGQHIWSEEEKRNYALTPMFMVRARK
ncbi:class I SAM-dependent methyltransferase [Butyrivibrio sp. LC3010]|uniref:class I SAM-dependent methyltransferase n=1 Tax=Butyrivibrio sp. LC3010 TaxID=1280680 RepID=UPI0003FE5DCC|nr:class I SAM-dependent methyltransferase [Butyrivibrio sp. LC3010]